MTHHPCILKRLDLNDLTHWGRVTHICVSKLNIIGSDNGLSPGRRQAIIWINAGILLSGPLATNFSEILIEIYIFSLKKMYMEMSSGNRRPFCLGLKVLMPVYPSSMWDLSSVIDAFRYHCSLWPTCCMSPEYIHMDDWLVVWSLDPCIVCEVCQSPNNLEDI